MKNLKVFTDFHHSGLLQSLILLFEDRLEGSVYRPIGRRWYVDGFWKVFDHPATVAQYLDIGGATPDGTPPLNNVISKPSDFVYKCFDISNKASNKAITFDGFMMEKFDIVIASLPQHIQPFRRLCDIHPNHPKLIYQIGNAWNISIEEGSMLDGVLASAYFDFPGIINGHNGKPLLVTRYHQEFDLNEYRPEWTFNNWDDEFSQTPTPLISSFVNCFSLDNLFSEDWELFQKIEKLMPEYAFRCYGGQCRDGGAGHVPTAIRLSSFVWHTKRGGDGYGHIIHNVPACGRPLIVKKEYYVGKLAESLLVDGGSCITIDGLSPTEIVNKIRHYEDPVLYQNLCIGAYSLFCHKVDFEKEQKQIEDFLDML